jgi:hypothetical protein
MSHKYLVLHFDVYILRVIFQLHPLIHFVLRRHHGGDYEEDHGIVALPTGDNSGGASPWLALASTVVSKWSLFIDNKPSNEE